MPLNDSGKEITEDDDIFIDDPKQLVSLDLSLPRRDISRDLQLVACGASAYTSSELRHTHCLVPSMCKGFATQAEICAIDVPYKKL